MRCSLLSPCLAPASPLPRPRIALRIALTYLPDTVQPLPAPAFPQHNHDTATRILPYFAYHSACRPWCVCGYAGCCARVKSRRQIQGALQQGPHAALVFSFFSTHFSGFAALEPLPPYNPCCTCRLRVMSKAFSRKSSPRTTMPLRSGTAVKYYDLT